jgi:hypothetical protein
VTSGPRYQEARTLQRRLGSLVKATDNVALVQALEDLTVLACTPFDAADQADVQKAG